MQVRLSAQSKQMAIQKLLFLNNHPWAPNPSFTVLATCLALGYE